MRFTFINIRDILQKQNEILKVDSVVVFVYCFISAFYALKGRKVKS